ncbi:hypothetical protein PPYR_05106 [Photinus pyralis]|uniref:Serine/threonine-protein kinase receptor n=1 Tax=Photinus pyralis TaxID=7054 RepID=A0A1Y1ME07_PHOPY|nr:activin receptor type-2A isoform X2 [Photinus pyralis]KAB0802920.1 hypothetical protein PPYR_05106 [Photinus pyralis]
MRSLCTFYQEKIYFIIYSFLFLSSFVRMMSVSNDRITTRCEFYNQTMCNEANGDGGRSCTREEECEAQGDGKRSHCYVVWKGDENGNLNLTLKGCFLNNEDCYNKTACVERAQKPKNSYLFCCCEGNMCNQNFTWEPAPTEPTPVKAVNPVSNQMDNIYLPIGIVMIAVLLGVIGGFVVYWLYRRHKHVFNELPSMEPHPRPPPSPYLDLRPIQLVEIKARGRFGAVWKAYHKTEEVAVKVFPIQDKQSWLSEQEIYKLPYMDHPNILQFIGVEKRGDNLQAEFWLITEYHERGSLCDFLKAHTLTWLELCRIAESMTMGLMHLHEDVQGKLSDQLVKPAIAHRDFKSKNVLLKNDMTACIADFGLALIFYSGKSCGDTHGQVGTRRYMAPEVLEGAINFTSDAFLRIDMYACGLVLWELVSRCTAQDSPISEYRLPFEEEVGQHPTLEDMQESVVQRKVRPTIQQNWRNHPGLAGICDTMEECWDHDAEARLSASCVMERVIMLRRYQNTSTAMRIENDSPLKENNM